MPNFKQGGRGFQMKGWSAFTKKDDYTPQSQDPDSMDYKPQSVVEDKKEEKPTIKVDLKTKDKKQGWDWKKTLKKIGKGVLQTQPLYHAIKAVDKQTGGKLSEKAEKIGEKIKSSVMKKRMKKEGSKTKAGKIIAGVGKSAKTLATGVVDAVAPGARDVIRSARDKYKAKRAEKKARRTEKKSGRQAQSAMTKSN